MLEDSNEAEGDILDTSIVDEAEVDGSSAEQSPQPHLSPASLTRHLCNIYGRRPMRLVNRYFRFMFNLAVFSSNVTYLTRCRTLRVVPREYRAECPDIKNTHRVARILDDCSYQLMVADLKYNRKRKLQVSRFVERLLEKLEEVMSPEDLGSVVALASSKYKDVLGISRDEQRYMFAELLTENDTDPEQEDNQEE
ncbi:uncharacterized protein LOC144160728 [Haemaphysalis longicornis]